MKTTLLAALLFLSYTSHALQIHNVTISAISANAINVSLNTEAVELYYFNSWQYSISGNNITVEASFISGFGSTIAYLNNNFQIPLDTITPATYHLTVKVYYGNSAMLYNPQRLQDEISGTFKTPLREKIVIKRKGGNKINTDAVFFPNPTTGEIEISDTIHLLDVYDSTGKTVKKGHCTTHKILLDNLGNGIYYIEYYFLDKHRIAPIILQKR